MLKDKLRALREQHGFSQAKLAEFLGVSPAAYSTYEMGTRDVSSDKVVKLAKYYGVSTDYLYDIEKNENNEFNNSERTIIKKYRKLDTYGKKLIDNALDIEYDRCTSKQEQPSIPMISIRYSLLSASAGTGAYLDDENMEMRLFPDTPEARRADLVIPVEGRSMEPMFYDGDELFVHRQENVEIGEIGIFIKDGKGYVKEAGEDRLISINPDYEDIYADDTPIFCVGKVIGKVQVE